MTRKDIPHFSTYGDKSWEVNDFFGSTVIDGEIVYLDSSDTPMAVYQKHKALAEETLLGKINASDLNIKFPLIERFCDAANKQVAMNNMDAALNVDGADNLELNEETIAQICLEVAGASNVFSFMERAFEHCNSYTYDSPLFSRAVHAKLEQFGIQDSISLQDFYLGPIDDEFGISMMGRGASSTHKKSQQMQKMFQKLKTLSDIKKQKAEQEQLEQQLEQMRNNGETDSSQVVNDENFSDNVTLEELEADIELMKLSNNAEENLLYRQKINNFDPVMQPDFEEAWMKMKVIPTTLKMPHRGHGIKTPRPRPSDMGVVLKYPHRFKIDQRIFAQKRSRLGKYNVLIDASGSMRFTNEDILTILKMCPNATVAMYTSGSGHGGFWLLAKDGKVVSDIPDIHAYGGNGIDGPALKWLAEQRGHKIWISDGYVHGAYHTYGTRNLYKDCLEIKRQANIKQVLTIEGAQKVISRAKKVNLSKIKEDVLKVNQLNR